MKRKGPPTTEPVIDEQILEQAKAALQSEVPPRRAKCSVCEAECAPHPTEQLCWVCRRLKISAWRDQDQQLNAQE